MLIVLLIITILFSMIFYLTWPNRIKSAPQIFENKIYKIDPTNELKVISWNMAYLYGPGSEGIGYKKQSKAYFEAKLIQAIELLRKENADIILLQEVDICASKTYKINQARAIADALNLNYAPAKSWHCRYVPYPFLDFKNHFGYVESGGAILSKYPIKNNFVYLHKKPKKNYFFNLFYISRFSQVVTMHINNKDLNFVNSHLEAFSKKNRMEQARFILEQTKDQNVLLFGGDFNTLPSVAKKRSHFTPHDIEDFIGDETYQIFTEKFNDSLSEAEYSKDESKWFSFSSAHEDRKLDHIFVKKSVTVSNFRIIKSDVSDHYPIACHIQL